MQNQGPANAVVFSPGGNQLFVGGGGERVGNTRIQSFPDEEVRLYRIVEAAVAKP